VPAGAPQAQQSVFSDGMADVFNTHRLPLENSQDPCVQYEHQRNEYKPELPISDGMADAFNTHRLSLENSQGPADAFNTHRLPLENCQGPADAFNTHRLPLEIHQACVQYQLQRLMSQGPVNHTTRYSGRTTTHNAADPDFPPDSMHNYNMHTVADPDFPPDSMHYNTIHMGSTPCQARVVQPQQFHSNNTTGANNQNTPPEKILQRHPQSNYPNDTGNFASLRLEFELLPDPSQGYVSHLPEPCTLPDIASLPDLVPLTVWGLLHSNHPRLCQSRRDGSCNADNACVAESLADTDRHIIGDVDSDKIDTVAKVTHDDIYEIVDDTPPQSVPAAHTPVAQVPAVHAPVALVPAVRASVAQVPAVRVSVAQVPAVHAPVAQVPAVHAPFAQVPTVHAPVAHVPAMRAPVATASVRHDAAVQNPMPQLVLPMSVRYRVANIEARGDA
jgi:hypothetical protein